MHHFFSRREFLGCVATGTASWYLSQFQEMAAWAAPSGGFFETHGPIDRSLEDVAPSQFYGDEFETAHKVLWDLPGFLKKNPLPTQWEETPLVIIGGGLSGLFSAYQFRSYKPIVLEQASRFGGNAKGQSWRGTDFGLGSAYFTKPIKGSPLYTFYNELKLDKLVQVAPEGESVASGGRIIKAFWSGAAEPEHKATYEKFRAFLETIYQSKKNPFPDIPTSDAKVMRTLQELDKLSLREAIEAAVGKLPPLLSRSIESYSWSVFAASPDEVSAAAGLNFMAGELAPICVAPGGNAGVAEHILKNILSSGVPQKNLRPGSLVIKVSLEGEKVKVVYLGSDGKLQGVIAKAAIMACPKYVAAKIVQGLEPDRLAAIAEIEYRSYLTAGVLIQKPLRTRFYDLFMLSAERDQSPNQATDVVVGSLGQGRGRNTALTLYRAMPKGNRAGLMEKNALSTVKAQFQAQIEKELFPLLGYTSKDIVDLRIARWGHAIPVPKTGTFFKHLPQTLRKPFGTRVFFIEQDNWLTPAIEIGAGEVVMQEPLILSALGRSK